MLGCSDIRCSTLLCYAPADAKLLYYTMLSTQKKLSVYMHACMHACRQLHTDELPLAQTERRDTERERERRHKHAQSHTHIHMHACMRITCICKKLQCARLPLALSENLHVGMRLYLYIHTHTQLSAKADGTIEQRTMHARP